MQLVHTTLKFTRFQPLFVSYKEKLSVENIVLLAAEVKKMEATQKRWSTPVLTAVTQYNTAETERKRLDDEKRQVRERIDELMQTNLQQYQTAINELLKIFGAEFSIEQLKSTYVGGEPRTEYGLQIRNISVKLGSRADMATGQSFATTLSEADKRTLAFAFFIARLKADPHLSDKLVVLDDPVSSFDLTRMRQSVQLVAKLVDKCHQIIVLSHDPHFIRELTEHLAKQKPPIVASLLSLTRTSHDYSTFSPCDIDDVCATPYYRNHRLVVDYIEGRSTVDKRDVAKAIRPLLEGYYHRRFPHKFPHMMMFGMIINLAANAQHGDPLEHLQASLEEMSEINDYVGQFHHDGSDAVPITDGELLAYAKRALDLVYRNS